jgi:hypothetical protein
MAGGHGVLDGRGGFLDGALISSGKAGIKLIPAPPSISKSCKCFKLVTSIFPRFLPADHSPASDTMSNMIRRTDRFG